jgi:hypothetical protein
MGKRSLLPWETYHRAVQDAKAARRRLLRSIFSLAQKRLKGRICSRAKRWKIQVCLQCC